MNPDTLLYTIVFDNNGKHRTFVFDNDGKHNQIKPANNGWVSVFKFHASATDTHKESINRKTSKSIQRYLFERSK